MSTFKEVDLKDLNLNPWNDIGKKWTLITAGNEEQVNTMTASWGGMGVIWGYNVVYIFVRQSRYTKEFIDEGSHFSVSFYPESEKKALAYLGRVSGRDEDKIAKVGFETLMEDGVPYFRQAEMVFICEKLSRHYIGSDGILDKDVIAKHYDGSDADNYHDMYIGKIEKVLVKED